MDQHMGILDDLLKQLQLNWPAMIVICASTADVLSNTLKKVAGTIKKMPAAAEVLFKERHDEGAVLDDQAVQAINDAIAEAMENGDFRDDADKALFRKIAGYLTSDDYELRVLAVSELGRVGNKAAMSVLVKAAETADEELMLAIIKALVDIADMSASPVLEQLACDGNQAVRKASLKGLHDLKSSNASILLIAALKDEDADVQCTAATLLAWRGGPDAISAIIQSLGDRDARVRKALITALANLDDRVAVRPLIRSLGDSSMDVRCKALDAIRQITGHNVDFNVAETGQALAQSIEELQDWWWSVTVGGGDARAAAPSPAHVRGERAPVPPIKQSPPEKKSGIAAGKANIRKAPARSKGPSEEDRLAELGKFELLKICNEKGIECEVTVSKADIIRLILQRAAITGA